MGELAQETAREPRRRHFPSGVEMREAELGFRQLLRRKRFPEAFLERNAADLLGQARFEYARQLAAGEEMRNPSGWIIHCAWRRTQNLLERESRLPRHVPIGGGPASAEAGPDEELLERERHRALREAVAELDDEQRQVIAMTYFEGHSVREACRLLGWDHCKGDRRHHAALARLRELLGVKNGEELQIEIGAAAWAALGGADRAGLSLPAVAQAALEQATRGAGELATRAGELARRLGSGGAERAAGAAGARGAEAGAGMLAACTAGVCGAAAAACLATGVVGPGLGDHHGDEGPKTSAPRASAAPAKPAATSQPTAEGAIARTAEPAHASDRRARRRRARKANERRARRAATEGAQAQASSAQVGETFDAFSGGEVSSPSPEPTAPAPSHAGGSGPASTPPASGEQISSQFAY